MEKSIVLVVGIIFLSPLGVTTHASAMMVPSSHMNSMSHSANAELSCITLCTTAVNKKEDDVQSLRPYYGLLKHHFNLSKQHSERAKLAVSVKPPPKTKLHILFAVFRA